MVHRLEAEYLDRVDFVYLYDDDPDNDAVFDFYGIRGRPVFTLIAADGTRIVQWFGSSSEAELRQVLDDYLATLG